ALSLLGENILVVLGILPPVFILLGLFDVWIPRERVAPHMGEDSGLKGTVLSVLLGACSAGPLYIAFPVAEVMLRKGTSLRNVFVFIGAWSTMRIPMILFEIQNLGAVFGLTRYFVSLVGILLMALLMDRVLNTAEKTEIIARFQEE
ncbi:MAG TPA: permease, partial [Synergistales bacterium]|nr:permease [Synergistales bacterium]